MTIISLTIGYYLMNKMFRASKKIVLPDPSVRSVTIKYLEKIGI